jgi:predicted O-linked N-acetylglucosamine transferase (SPINDLY family)
MDMTISQTLQQALQFQRAGQLAEAEALYRQILSIQPDNADALHRLGLIAYRNSRFDAALELINQALAIRPAADDYCNLGLVLSALGRFSESVQASQKSLSLDPLAYEAWYNMGNALRDLGQAGEAIAAYQRALSLRPDHSGSLANMGSVLRTLGRLDEAAAVLRRAIQLSPRNFQAHNNLGNALRDAGQLDAAVACLEQALSLRPEDARARGNLGNALLAQGRLVEAISQYNRAIASNPDAADIASDRLFALQFCPKFDAPAILGECRSWNDRFATALARPAPSHRHARLRIGYASPDFRAHCQSLFTTPLFTNHNRQDFEIYCYADVPAPDSVTDRLRSSVEVWRNTGRMTDEAVADLIRHDKIDILVDLTMHMARGRPLVLARKPAPLQVAWLAYPGTTGLSAIDARFTDPYLDPPGAHDDWYSEKSIRLPDTFWCYDPTALTTNNTPLPEPGDLPVLKNGSITFGCLNNFCKINNDVLQLWSRVMLATPGSRLLLLAPDGWSRRWAADRLAELGIAAVRVEFVAHQPRYKYLAEYRRVDIGLDTIPYNGHTTSLDSFWMGVPVITRVGVTVVGRAGFSQLSNLQLTELAAWTDDEFVSIAAALAHDTSRLAELRRTLRERMRQSPLMDGPRFARAVEAEYRRLWSKTTRDEDN